MLDSGSLYCTITNNARFWPTALHNRKKMLDSGPLHGIFTKDVTYTSPLNCTITRGAKSTVQSLKVVQMLALWSAQLPNVLLSLTYVITKRVIDCGSLNCIITKDTTDTDALNCTITNNAIVSGLPNCQNTNVQSQNACPIPSLSWQTQCPSADKATAHLTHQNKHRAHYRPLIAHPLNRKKPSQALRAYSFKTYVNVATEWQLNCSSSSSNNNNNNNNNK